MLLSAVAVVAATCGPAFAGFNSGRFVTFNGEPMFSIKSGAEGLSAERRAWIAQDNFDNALATITDKSPSAVSIVKVNGGYTLRLGGHYIATADFGSAHMEGMSPLALANSWASAMRDRLADSAATAQYVASLRDDNMLKANVSVVETDLVRASDDAIPFRMAEGSLSMHPTLADNVVLVLNKAVVLDNGLLPEKAVLVGKIVKDSGPEYVTFETATMPDGSIVRLSNVVASSTFVTDAPHPVLTLNMPADELNGGGRKPALVGVGAEQRRIAVIEERANMVAASEVEVPM